MAMDQVQVLGWGEPTLKDPLVLNLIHGIIRVLQIPKIWLQQIPHELVVAEHSEDLFIVIMERNMLMHKDEFILLFRLFSKLQTNPTNNSFQNYTVNYDGKTKVMTVNYAGQTWSYNLANQKIGQQSDYQVIDKVIPTNTLWNDTKNMTLLSNAGNPSELAFALFASTGSGVNLQQFRLESFDYTTGGSYITIKYVDDITGVELKPSKTISGLGGNIQDLTSYLDIPGYKVQRNNANTYNLYRGGNKIEFKKGKVTVTYTYSPTVEKKVDRIYTYVGENASDLTVAQNL